MKKVLLASTFLALTATVAAAEISLSGYGRFGLDYNSEAPAGASDTQINMRMRVNIDGSVETDSGVTFGGRIRLQYTDGQSAATLSPAMLYATYEGLRVEVGNANTAFDSVALLYNAEIGYLDRTFGGGFGDYLSFSSGPYEEDRMGIYASYAIAGINLRASMIDLDQTVSSSVSGDEEEFSISADYTTGQFTVAAAYVDNVGGVDNDSSFFIGAEYAVNDATNVGILYFDNSAPLNVNDSRRITLYGNYTVNALTFEGYIADDDKAANLTDTAFGLGVDYDLGGARLGADIHRSYAEETIVGLGVRFDF